MLYRLLPKTLNYVEVLRWSSLSKFYKSRGAQIISLVPLLGYFVLWSDSLAPLLEYTRNLGSAGWLSPVTRLYFLYFGSLFVLVGWLVWAWSCPDTIKRFEDRDLFVNRCITSSDLDYFALSTGMINRFLDIIKKVGEPQRPGPLYDRHDPQGQWPWDHSSERLRQLLHTIRAAARNEDKSVALTIYYQYVDFGRFEARLTTAILGGIGLAMFSVPSFEVFILVLRSLGRKMIGL